MLKTLIDKLNIFLVRRSDVVVKKINDDEELLIQVEINNSVVHLAECEIEMILQRDEVLKQLEEYIYENIIPNVRKHSSYKIDLYDLYNVMVGVRPNLVDYILATKNISNLYVSRKFFWRFYDKTCCPTFECKI